MTLPRNWYTIILVHSPQQVMPWYDNHVVLFPHAYGMLQFEGNLAT